MLIPHFIISLFAFSLFLINKSWFGLSRVLWSRGLVMHGEFPSLLAFERQCLAVQGNMPGHSLRNFVILSIVTYSWVTLSLFGCGLFIKVSEVRSSAGESLGAWPHGGTLAVGYQCFMASVPIDFHPVIYLLNSRKCASAQGEASKCFASRKLQFGKYSSNEG